MRREPLVAVLLRELVDRGWEMEESYFIGPGGRRLTLLEAVRMQVERDIAVAEPDTDTRGLHPDVDLADSGEAAVHRAMEAVKRAIVDEYAADADAPNLTIVATVPPDGRLGIASTEPSTGYIMQALIEGQGAVRRAVRLRAARQ